MGSAFLKRSSSHAIPCESDDRSNESAAYLLRRKQQGASAVLFAYGPTCPERVVRGGRENFEDGKAIRVAGRLGPLLCRFSAAGRVAYPGTATAGGRKAPRHEIAEVSGCGAARSRCRGHYGELAAGSGIRMGDRGNRCDRFVWKHWHGWKGERVVGTVRDKLGGAIGCESRERIRAWTWPAASQRESRGL